MADDQLFYVGQKALIEKDGKILVLNDPDFGADLPGGKIQVGETDFLESFLREVKEETGLRVKIHEPFFTGLFEVPATFNHRHAGKKIFSVYFKATYVSGTLTISDEHDTFFWVTKKDYKKFLGEKNKETSAYKALEAYFTNYS